MLLRDRPTVYNVGDHVRVILSADIAAMRRRNKNSLLKKYNAIYYSAHTYTVANVINEIGGNQLRRFGAHIWDLRRKSYWLTDDVTHLPLGRHYFASEMIRAPNNTVDPHIRADQVSCQVNRLTQI